MKRIISAMLTVLICVLTLCGCEKTPTGQESGSESSFAESDEASESSEAENGESEDNLQRREALFEELNGHYLPLYGVLINCEEWDSPEEIGANGFYIWYTQYIIANTTVEERFERYSGNSESGCWVFPAEEFEGFIQRYFNISADFLRSSDIYIPEYNWYDIGGSERWLPNYSVSVASPEDISISGNTATAKLTCASNLDSSVAYFWLSLDISEETYRFTGCRAESGESKDNEEELRSAAKEMGYFDEQINEIIGYGFTLAQLLSPEENNSTNIEMCFSPDGNYALGGYWYFDGERGCAYLKNLKSGKITVFSECLNRYSHYGFTSNGNIYFFDYALSAEKQSVLNFYSPENIKSPYDCWLPDSDGTLIWVRTDYIASEDALLTFWVNVEADFFPDGNSVYPQYNYSSALIHCDNLTIEELNTKISLQTNKYGQIVTPELDRRDNGDKRVILLDSAYRIDFSPFTIGIEPD